MATNAKLFNDTPYLPFEARPDQTDTSLDIPENDIRILRELAKRYAEIASLPEQQDRIERWKRINDLKGGRPVLWANEVCWHEMNVNDELTMRCSSELGLRLEGELRRTIYQWNHMRGDMVVENQILSPFIVENTGFGISTKAEVRETNAENTIASRHFFNQINDFDDLSKIKDPIITVNQARSKQFHEAYCHLFEDIIPVRQKGCSGFWFAPWDDIVFWMGAEDALVMLYENPELMHAVIERLVDVYLCALDQLDALHLVASNNCNVRIGSGGYGYTNELPADMGSCATGAMWGSSAAQIFGSVSPAMHDDFGLAFEKKWLNRFGMSYYGCCEPLHDRIDMLGQIKSLRKISISPWANIAAAAEQMKERYVISLKPSPAALAFEMFDEAAIRKDLEEKLEAAKGCCVEIIIKDISTVKGEPQRLWRWMDIAMETAARFE